MSKKKKKDIVKILNVRIHKVSLEEIIEEVDFWIETKKSHYIVTPNVDYIMSALSDNKFRKILDDADLSVCDSMVLYLVLKWLYRTPIPQRIAGGDLICPLCELSVKKGYRVYLLGSEHGIANKSAKILQHKYKKLNIVGTYSPSFTFLENEKENALIVKDIIAKKPDILFVALGSPKQEKWIYSHLTELSVPVCIGIGAGLDYIAGKLKRVPLWCQKIGFEWFGRFFQQPKHLFRRILRDSMFFYYVIREIISNNTQ